MINEDDSKARGYVGVGGLATLLKVSTSTIRQWESLGIVPPAGRIEPHDQRIWPLADIEVIRQRVAARRTTSRHHGDAA